MSFDRRRFLQGSVAGVLAAACGSGKPPAPVVTAAPNDKPQVKAGPKSILILGGTGFLGPHVVAAARARGHTLTLFNRGKTRPGLFPDIETLQGDRDGKLDALNGRTWDAVVDTSGYVPRIVKMSAELLAPSVKQYIFISTISVYDADKIPNADETAKLLTIADPANEDVPTNYGALKALSEQAAEAAMPGKVCTLRPGLIIGPGDPTGRFTHWPTRIADGGEVLCPGDGSTAVQYIDGRDLGVWIVKLIEDGTLGTYNALGPDKRITMREVLEACNDVSGNKATLTWVDGDFLEKQGVGPWQDMPMWIEPKGDMAGFGTMQNARAIKAGLTFRPIRDTAKDTLAWIATVPDDKRGKMRSSGIKRDKEEQVLAAWKAKK